MEVGLELPALVVHNQVPTVAGGKWTTSTLRVMIANPRIAGLRAYHGEVICPGIWEAIITPADRDRVLATQASRKVSGRRSPRRYLLSPW